MKSKKCPCCEVCGGLHGVHRRAIPRPRKSIENLTAEDGDPTDLITLTVALEEFQVSRSTIIRAIKAGDLKDYRKSEKGMHIVSRAEVAQKHLPK